MALPLILRNCTNSQAIPKLFRSNNGLSLNSRRTYSSLVATTRKNAGLISQKSTNFALEKRGMSSDHSKLWPIERIVTIGLLGVTPAVLISPNIFLDDAFAILTVVHFHWGLEACVVDYVRPILFGSAIPKVSLGLLYILSFATLGGLLYYNHHSIGIGNTCKKLWAIEK